MTSINKLRKRNLSSSTNSTDDIYGQYLSDYQLYFDNALNKTKYKDKYNNNINGECVLLDVSNNNDKNGDEKWITTLPNSNIELLSIISLEFAKDLTQYWVVEDKEYLAIPSHDKFKISPLFYSGVLKRYGINDISIDTKVIDNDAIVKEKKIYYSPKVITVERGDYIYYGYCDKTYLVTDVQNFTDLPFADSTECNHILKYIVDGELYSMLSVVVNNPRFTLGLKSEVAGITEGDDMLRVKVPFTNSTKKIYRGQRFIINGQAWKATKTDYTVDKGLITILLGEDNINPEIDDVELEIANGKHAYSIMLNSNTESLQETGTYQISTTVKDNGVIITNPNITYSSSDETIVTVSDKGIVSAIKIGNAIITATIGNVSSELNLTVIAKTSQNVVSYNNSWSNGLNLNYNSASTLVCTKTINGVIDSSLKIEYSFDANGQALIDKGLLAITVKSDASIQIRNKSTTISSVSLTVKDSLDVNKRVILSQDIKLLGGV